MSKEIIMLDEQIILKESEVQYENRLNNVFGNNRPISFNPKYTALNSGTPGEIIIHNSNNKDAPRKIKLDNNEILDMEFSSLNNDLLAIRTINNIISIYDLNEYKETEEQMKPKYTLKPECEIVLMTFNPVNPNILCLCGKEGNICVWDINNDKTFYENSNVNNPTGLLWSPNGNLVGICFENGLLIIYNYIENTFEEIFNEKISQKKCSKNFFTWLSDNSFATVGWGEDNRKKLSIYYNFKNNDNSILGECSIFWIEINEDDYDIIPFSNKEHNLIYLVNNNGNENSSIPSITVYEFNENQILKKSGYIPTHSAAFSLLINNNYCDSSKNEIGRFIEYNSEENKIFFVSIFKEIEKEQNDLKKDELGNEHNDLKKDELENEQKNNNNNNDNEKNELIKKIAEKDEEIISLKRKIEDNNKVIEEQNNNINNYKEKEKKFEEELNKIKDELDKEIYKKEPIIENKNMLEKEPENNEISSINNNINEKFSFDDFSNLIKDNKCIYLKFKGYAKNKDNNVSKNDEEEKENKEKEYKIYNLDVIDKNKDIGMVFGGELRMFTFEKYSESMNSE